MKVLVASAFAGGTQFAHAINTVKMAHGFARLGHDVLLVCRRPKRARAQPQQLADQYGIDVPLKWRQLPYFLGEHARFACATSLVARRFRPDLVYARNYVFPTWSSRLGFPTIAETHAHTDNRSKSFLRMIDASRRSPFRQVVTISPHLAQHYETLGVPREKLLVLPDAVDLRLFRPPRDPPPSPYPSDRPNVVYSGHLYDYKGVPTVLEAAALLPEVWFHFVGGLPGDLDRQRDRAQRAGLDNVVFHGLQDHGDVPRFLWHADLLLLPPSAHHPSALWTSPVKLGEYFASGVPVVATKIPALREAIPADSVCFVDPDNPADLAGGIRQILEDPERGRTLARAARNVAETLSYENRAQAMINRVMVRPSDRPAIKTKPSKSKLSKSKLRARKHDVHR